MTCSFLGCTIVVLADTLLLELHLARLKTRRAGAANVFRVGAKNIAQFFLQSSTEANARDTKEHRYRQA